MRSVFVLVMIAGAMGTAWVAASALRNTPAIDRDFMTAGIPAPQSPSRTVPPGRISAPSSVLTRNVLVIVLAPEVHRPLQSGIVACVCLVPPFAC